jgi:hypothetical protein
MEEIKEILGHEHVIFKITEELVDHEEEVDILEKIGSIIDSGTFCDKMGNDGMGNDKMGMGNGNDKMAALKEGPKEVKTKTPDVENIGWTDWIRSFMIYNDPNTKEYELSYEELKKATLNRSALPRLLPEQSKEPKQIVFGGCAGMYHYFLGIASVLQEKFDMSDVVFGCVSGGSFPALALILNLPVRDLHESWNKEILRDLNKSSLKAFSRLNGIVFEKSKKYIPNNAHLTAKDRLFISLTEFPSLKNHIVHNWQTIDSLLDCIQASCFIPIFDKRFWTIFDKTKYVDGGLSNNKPIPYPDSPYIYITTDRWREIPLHWYWCYTCENWSDKLFDWGVEDTLAHLDEFQFLSVKR